MSVTDAITLIACVATCARLILFRRAGLRYRWYISALAWLLIVSTGSTALNILLHRTEIVTWGEVGIAAVLCMLTFRARGNVAHILRPNHDSPSGHR